MTCGKIKTMATQANPKKEILIDGQEGMSMWVQVNVKKSAVKAFGKVFGTAGTRKAYRAHIVDTLIPQFGESCIEQANRIVTAPAAEPVSEVEANSALEAEEVSSDVSEVTEDEDDTVVVDDEDEEE